MCGIAGASGPTINADKIKILMLYNDARGGDSCGVYDTGLLTQHKSYSEKTEGTFRDLLSRFVIKTKVPVLLAHARAASPGIAVTKENAHPFVFENLVGMHNGVIRNIESLCKEYGVEKEPSDSKSLFKIISALDNDLYKVAELLSKYIGAAALAWRDVQGKLFLYRGESTEYETSLTVYEERPLYIGKIGKTLYFSSIHDSLSAIDATIMELEGNTIYQIANGEIEKRVIVNRDKGYMSFPKAYPSTTKKGASIINLPLPSTTTKTMHTTNGSGSDSDLYTDKLLGEEHPANTGGKIYLWRGRYCRNGHLVCQSSFGHLNIREDGTIAYGSVDYNPKDDSIIQSETVFEPNGEKKTIFHKGKRYWFYNGNMFHDSSAYVDFLATFAKEGRVVYINGSADTYFQNPVRLDLPFIPNQRMETFPNMNFWLGGVEAIGSAVHTFPFSDKVYIFEMGVCVDIRDKNATPPELGTPDVLEKEDDVDTFDPGIVPIKDGEEEEDGAVLESYEEYIFKIQMAILELNELLEEKEIYVPVEADADDSLVGILDSTEQYLTFLKENYGEEIGFSV